MARNGTGTYILPAGNPVSDGTLITSNWANTTLNDIANGLTLSLPRDGQAPMTGTLRIMDGSASTPSVAFNSETSTGLFRQGVNTLSLSVTGVEALRLNSSGAIGAYGASYGTAGQFLTSGGSAAAASWTTPALAPPAGAILYFANGAAVSRTTYAALFAAIGTTWGAGDGVSTFNLPDLRGAFMRAWDDSRGIDTGRVFASFQDSQNLTHSHTVTDPGHTHAHTDPGHNHSFNDPGHNHGVWDNGHGHGISDPGHSHSWSQLLGDNNNDYAGPPAASNGAGLLYYSMATGGSGTGISINSGGGNHGNHGSGTGCYNSAAATGISNNTNTTGITTVANGGSETRVKNYALMACIRY
jgi:phage-related tail fiber protein